MDTAQVINLFLSEQHSLLAFVKRQNSSPTREQYITDDIGKRGCLGGHRGGPHGSGGPDPWNRYQGYFPGT